MVTTILILAIVIHISIASSSPPSSTCPIPTSCTDAIGQSACQHAISSNNMTACSNPNILLNCLATCNRCELEDMETRCEKWGPAQLKRDTYDKLFQHVVTHHGAKLRHYPNPWIATFDGFFTSHEAKTIIQHGLRIGFAPSLRLVDKDGITNDRDFRTSSNVWCADDACRNDPVIVSLLQRVSQMLHIPQKHFEWMQIVRYRVGEQYKAHVDVHTSDLFAPRYLTFILYLNDMNVTSEEEDSGGQTMFTYHNLTISPVQGSGVLFSLLNLSNQSTSIVQVDEQARHASLPVKRRDAIKYMANLWIRTTDMIEMGQWKCKLHGNDEVARLIE